MCVCVCVCVCLLCSSSRVSFTLYLYTCLVKGARRCFLLWTRGCGWEARCPPWPGARRFGVWGSFLLGVSVFRLGWMGWFP
ncbi:hypothetical protein F5X98DRAFT_354699 [Xylaria grammica]|nr:hypothetical protein F5X98DRAFT_354699 [Xylaria grammica]